MWLNIPFVEHMAKVKFRGLNKKEFEEFTRNHEITFMQQIDCIGLFAATKKG